MITINRNLTMEGVRSAIFILLIATAGCFAHVHMKIAGRMLVPGDDTIIFEYPKKSGSYSGSGSFSSSNSASFSSSKSGSYSFSGGVTPMAGSVFGNGAHRYGGAYGGSVAGAGAGGYINGGSLMGAGLHGGIVMIPVGSGATDSGSKIHSNAGHGAGSFGVTLGSSAGGSAGSYGHGSTQVYKKKDVPIKVVVMTVPTQQTHFVEKTPVTGQAGLSISTLPVNSHNAAPGGKVDSYGNPIRTTNFNIYEGAHQSHTAYPQSNTESKLTLGSGGVVSGFHADSASGSNSEYAPTPSTVIKTTTVTYVTKDKSEPSGFGSSVSFGIGGSHADSASNAGSYNTQSNVKTASDGHYQGGFGGTAGVLGEQAKPGYAIGIGTQTDNQQSVKPQTTTTTTTQYSGNFGGSSGILGHQEKPGFAVGIQSGTGSDSGVLTSNQGSTNVQQQSSSHYSGGFGGASGVLGEQTKPGYAIGIGIQTDNQQNVKPQTTTTTTTTYSGNFGGSPGILGHQEKPGFAVGIQSGTGSDSGVLTSNQSSTNVQQQSSSHYSGGFGGAIGILGEQPKPGYAVGTNTDAGAHSEVSHGVAITMGTVPHEASSHTGSGGINAGSTYSENAKGHYAGSFGGAPGIITATGPATNVHIPAKESEVHVQSTPAPAVVVSGGTGSIPTSGLEVHGTNQYQGSHTGSGAVATSGSFGIGVGQNVDHHYSGTYGGAPGIITATGPAPNHPASGTVVTTTVAEPSAGPQMVISGTLPSLLTGGLIGGGVQSGHGGSIGLLTGSGINTAGSGIVNPGAQVIPTGSGVFGGGFGINHGLSGASASAGSFSSAGSISAGLGANGQVHEVDVGGPYGTGNGLYSYGSGGPTSASAVAVASAGTAAGNHNFDVKGGFGGSGSLSKGISFGLGGLQGGFGVQSHTDVQGGDEWRNYENGGAEGVGLSKITDGIGLGLDLHDGVGVNVGPFSAKISANPGDGLFGAHSDDNNSGGLFGTGFKLFK